jgi:hypothetical protein
MYQSRDDDRDGIVSLVKETADGLSRLVADHIRLARTEMIADARRYARGLGVTAAAAGLLGLGYVLGCVAGALALATVIGGPLAFAAVAGLHLLVGAVVMVVGMRQLRAERPMQETAAEVSRTVAVLTADSAPARRPIAAGELR